MHGQKIFVQPSEFLRESKSKDSSLRHPINQIISGSGAAHTDSKKRFASLHTGDAHNSTNNSLSKDSSSHRNQFKSSHFAKQKNGQASKVQSGGAIIADTKGSARVISTSNPTT